MNSKLPLLAVVLAVCLSAGVPARALDANGQLEDPVLQARYERITKDLRCLVCQNESIDESNADLAHDLRVLVRKRLLAGDTDRQMLDYVVARYGVFVLLDPPFAPATWLLWLTPPVLVLGAGGWLLLRARRRRLEPAPPVLTPEEHARASLLLGDHG